jgi:hypothetical protein
MMATSTGDLDGEFDLPTEIESLKAEVLSGRSWSANLHEQFPTVTQEGSDEDDAEDGSIHDPAVSHEEPFQMITSSSQSVRRPVIRAPSTHRDLLFLLAFIVNWGFTFLIHGVASNHNQSSPGNLSILRKGTWLALLNIATLLGSLSGALLLILLIFDIHRFPILRAAQPFAVTSQLALAVALLICNLKTGGAFLFFFYFFFFAPILSFAHSLRLCQLLNTDILVWLLGFALLASAGATLGQVQRTRDRMNFLLVLVEIASEVVSKYQAVFGVVGAFLVAQAVYLMWWAWVLEAVLTSSQTSAALSAAMICMLLLNLYWSTQTLRLSVAVVGVGVLTHYFANAYPAEDGNEKAPEGDDDMPGDGELIMSISPLLFDGALLPPMLPSDAEHSTTTRPHLSSGVEAMGRGRPELADGKSHLVVAHFLRCALTTSLGTVCRTAFSCLPVRVAELVLHVLSDSSCAGNNPALLWCEERSEDLVRNHHELLLVHVAAYSKGFTAAARDVWALIDESGLHCVQEDDVAGGVLHASCTGIGAVAAAVVAIIAGVGGEQSSNNDWGQSWSLPIAAAFTLAYVGAALSLQVVDSAVTAIYVVFAEHPVSLRTHFPLVHHRFSRLTEFSSYEDGLGGMGGR